MLSRFSVIACFFVLLANAGCEKAAPPQFRLNQVERLKQEVLHLDAGQRLGDDQIQEVTAILETLFGTPEDPKFPFVKTQPEHVSILELRNLELAAGAVLSDQVGKPQGLYREHCAQCHGISGDGAGPTSGFLFPYPRDFRLGKFKFKSTPLRRPPTNRDLKSILVHGIPGTAMPAFHLLPDEEQNALVDYVKFLSIRGQQERYLLAELPMLDGELFLEGQTGVEQLDSAELLAALRPTMGDQFRKFVVDRWLAGDGFETTVPACPQEVAEPGTKHDQLVAQGKKLFQSTGGCYQCHGVDGRGIGEVTNSYDDWTNDWANSAGVDLNERSTYQPFLKAGAHQPQPIRPRNLRQPIYRGGGQPEKLFRRITNGIEGTPMPAATALTAQQVWALVAYVKSLPDPNQQAGDE